MGTPEFAASWSDVRGAWRTFDSHLPSEVRAVLLGTVLLTWQVLCSLH